MVIEECAEEVVCGCDSVHITREVEVDILHRNYLSISAACCAALDSENRSERGFTECEDCLFANLSHSLGKTNRNGRLALACGGRIYSCNKDKLAVGVIPCLCEKLLGKLCFIVSVRFDLVLCDAELCCDLCDPEHFCLLCDLDICKHIVILQ